MNVIPSDISSDERTRLQDMHGVCWNTDDVFDADVADYREIMEYHRGIAPGHWYLPFHPELSRAVFETELDAYRAAEQHGKQVTSEMSLAARIAMLEASNAWALAALSEAERMISASRHDKEVLSFIQQVLKSGLAKPTEQNIRLNARPLSIRVGNDHTGGVIPLLISRCSDEEANAWSTADGRGVYYSREWAEQSDLIKTEAYQAEAEKRGNARRLLKATVIDISDYDGWVAGSGDEEHYAQDIPELLEKVRDRLEWAGISDEDIPAHLPAWAYCCTEDGFDFDIEDAIRCYLDDNHHEDAADWIKDWKGLDTFWNEWCEKQKDLRSQMIDYSRIVVIDRERYEAELVAARALLAEETVR